MVGRQRPDRSPRGVRALDPFLWLWRLLTSVRFALALIAFLALAGLLGALLPQIPGALRGDPAAVEAWLEEERGKFGALTDLLHDMGLFTLFDTAWFLAVSFSMAGRTGSSSPLTGTVPPGRSGPWGREQPAASIARETSTAVRSKSSFFIDPPPRTFRGL